MSVGGVSGGKRLVTKSGSKDWQESKCRTRKGINCFSGGGRRKNGD